jgi:hypothetical protein
MGKLALRDRLAMPQRSQATPAFPFPPSSAVQRLAPSARVLKPDEVDKLRQASARLRRHGSRERMLILLAYRHGLGVSGLVPLREFFGRPNTEDGRSRLGVRPHGLAHIGLRIAQKRATTSAAPDTRKTASLNPTRDGKRR